MADKSIINLSKRNFFDIVEKEYSNAIEFFYKWIDTYKEAVSWEAFFDKELKPKFHDIPLHMQKGILMEFFYLQKLLINVDLHPFKIGFTWTITDCEGDKSIIKPFTDSTYIDVANYRDTNTCFIDAVNMAFKVLSEKLTEKSCKIINLQPPISSK